MKQQIKHKSLTEYIVEDLEKKILAGNLKPNQRIIEEELCRTYVVSRSPVREALRILESRGFIQREPRKGVTVTKLSAKEAEDIYDIRARLDSLATYLAIKNKKQNVIDKLKNIHQRMIEAAQNDDVNEYFNLNTRFHDTIAQASENKRLIELLDSFNKQTMRYRRMVTRSPGWMKESMNIHETIIGWFESGKQEEAERYRQEAILNRRRSRFSSNTFQETEKEE